MLVLNVSLPEGKKDWILLDTESGVIAISAKTEGNQVKVVVKAPKSVKIERKSKLKKEKQNASKTN